MKTKEYAAAVVYQDLMISPLKTAITGDIHNGPIPAGATGENVAVNSLPISGDQFQVCSVNVNIHVPDLYIKINGIEQYIKNTKRIDELATIALGIVGEVNKADWSYWFDGQDTIAQPETSEHYANIRLDFKFFILD